MILKTIHIKNFKCITDSNEFRVEENVTCLVGKNESGKTSILQALAKLNPVEVSSAKFNILEYPRHAVSEYKRRAAQQPAEALITTWALSDVEYKLLVELIGPIANRISTVKISKGYDNRVSYDVGFDEAEMAESLLEAFEVGAHERGSLESIRDIRGLRKQLHGLQSPTQHQRALLEHLNSRFGDRSAMEVVGEALHARLPKFAYFSEYLQLPGQLSVDDLKSRMASNALLESDKVFLAFLGMIGRDVRDLEAIDQYDMLEAELEDASNRLTKEILRYWSQNPHMRVQFRFRQAMPGDAAPFNKGSILRIRIENTRHGTTTSFDERGSGFVWFFSFLGWFNLLKLNQSHNLVFLLDEPGPGLHALAQADLLRYFEERLAVDYQVLYTTHSPFMIDPRNLHRVRTVEDRLVDPKMAGMALENRDSGTRVGDNVLNADRDTVFPLQACLGYEMIQTLFLGEKTLLVESPSDLLYMQWFQRKLLAMGRTSLDPRWTIVPCGGIGKIASVLSLIGSSGDHAAVFSNLLSERNKSGNVSRTHLLRDSRILTADTYAGRSEAAMEDLMGDAAYVQLVNECYHFAGDRQVSLNRPASDTARSSVVKRVEGQLRTMGLGYQRYQPAAFLTQRGLDVRLEKLDVALVNFEQLFKDLNALLEGLPVAKPARLHEPALVAEPVASASPAIVEPKAVAPTVAATPATSSPVVPVVETFAAAPAAQDTVPQEDEAISMVNEGITMAGLNRNGEAIAVFDKVVMRFGDSANPVSGEQVAKALMRKGVTLGKLNRSDEEMAAYDDVVRRFGNFSEPVLREYVAKAIVNKGICLTHLGRSDKAIEVFEDVQHRFDGASDSGVSVQAAIAMVNRGVVLDRMNRSQEAIQVCDEVVSRFGQSSDVALREHVALGLLNKGDILSKQDQNPAALAAYDQLVAMFGGDTEIAICRQVATALMNKGISLGQLGRNDEEIIAYNEVVKRFGDSPDSVMRKKVAGALVNKAVVLGRHNQGDEALAVCDDVMRKFGASNDPGLAEEIAFSLVNKAVILSQLNRGKEVLRVCEEVIRRYGASGDPRLMEHVERAKELASRHRGLAGMLGWLK